MAQKGDSQHPWETHGEAMQALKSGVSDETDESDPSPPSAGGGTPGGSSDSDNPLWTAPAWRDEDTEGSAANPCPHCRGDLTDIDSGQVFEAEYMGEPTKGMTRADTFRCSNCNVLTDGEKVVTNVRLK